jgi:hypothetical protein
MTGSGISGATGGKAGVIKIPSLVGSNDSVHLLSRNLSISSSVQSNNF